jgi:hypothetical protein
MNWIDAFFEVLARPDVADPLKMAAMEERLGEWTRLLTGAVVGACAEIGWDAAAKGHHLSRLPQAGQEYLGLDVSAFGTPGTVTGEEGCESGRWPFPVAVFELENSPDNDRVAYSLWKVLCTRAPLRVVFGYRPDWETCRQLLQALTTAVVKPIPLAERGGLNGETLLFLGSRGEGETFPYGYFKVWRLKPDRAVFQKVR